MLWDDKMKYSDIGFVVSCQTGFPCAANAALSDELRNLENPSTVKTSLGSSGLFQDERVDHVSYQCMVREIGCDKDAPFEHPYRTSHLPPFSEASFA